MLSQINLTITMFEAYFISIRPFIDTPSTTSQILIIFTYITSH
jgi:hypothetical protein